jgi:ribosomal protein L37AE/L43A
VAILTLSILAISLIGLNEYAREMRYKDMQKELDKQERAEKKKDRCCECSYFRELTYSKDEKLWLCDKCE